MERTEFPAHSSLKRYNSAPYINNPGIEMPATCESTASTADIMSRCSSNDSNSSLAVQIVDRNARRFSTSSVMMLHSPTSSARAPSRIDQIRLEESVGQRDREAAHEKEIQSKMLMSQTWDELSLDDPDPDAMVTDAKPRTRSFTEPLHVITSAGSLSPTRIGKQCFSPSLQQSVRNSSFTPSPSPSPTRKTCVRRSLSPIVLRPSPLSAVKRRIEPESVDLADNYFSTPKRYRFSNSPSAGNSSSADVYQHSPDLRVSTSSVSGSSSADDAISCDERDNACSDYGSSSTDGISTSLAPLTSISDTRQSMILSSFSFRHIAACRNLSPVDSSSPLESQNSDSAVSTAIDDPTEIIGEM